MQAPAPGSPMDGIGRETERTELVEAGDGVLARCERRELLVGKAVAMSGFPTRTAHGPRLAGKSSRVGDER